MAHPTPCGGRHGWSPTLLDPQLRGPPAVTLIRPTLEPGLSPTLSRPYENHSGLDTAGEGCGMSRPEWSMVLLARGVARKERSTAREMQVAALLPMEKRNRT